MELSNQQLDHKTFLAEREHILQSWPTGKDVVFAEGVAYQHSLPETKRFSTLLREADRAGKTLLQPRAGVALLHEQIALLKHLEASCDVLPTTIDAYTRLNRYDEAFTGMTRGIGRINTPLIFQTELYTFAVHGYLSRVRSLSMGLLFIYERRCVIDHIINTNRQRFALDFCAAQINLGENRSIVGY